jgi:hypothetical protein
MNFSKEPKCGANTRWIPPILPPPELKAEALRDYLLLKFQRPGRTRLMPDGFEDFGPSIREIAGYVHPLMFDTEIENIDYGIAGSCFLVHYRGQLFVITANHCLTAENGNDVRIALDPVTKSFLPLKQLHRGQSIPPNQDYADLAIFEAAPEIMEAKEQQRLHALQLDSLKNPEMKIKVDAKLLVPGFPKCLNEVDYDRFVIHTQRYLPSGDYCGSAGRPGIHRMAFHELEQITWPDGMSGSPVYLVENHPEAHFFGLLGMLIRAHRYRKIAEFIGADVIFAALDKIIDSPRE